MPDSQTLDADTIGPECQAIAQRLATDNGEDGTQESIWRQYVTAARAEIAASRGLAYGS